MYEVDTGNCEAEIASYLDRKMKVRFHSANFNNKKYVFLGTVSDNTVSNCITVSSYREKLKDEKISIYIA